MRDVQATFSDQLAIVGELLREVDRMQRGERRATGRPAPSEYERELRLAGLAQRIAQAYTVIEGVLAFVARRIARSPLAGDNWHKQLVARCARGFDDPARPAVISAALAEELLELCEFRHVVRNIYPTRLDEARVRENLQRLTGAPRTFGAEAKVFATALRPSRRRPRRRRPVSRS